MCGIAGGENARKLIQHLEHRGDSIEVSGGEPELAFNLHSIVGHLQQPIGGEGTLVANCEIYNWEKLAEKHDLECENDAELLLKLLDIKGTEALDEIDGIYAFAYRTADEIIIARDLLGINPVWYSEEPFAFASEKQALEKEGFEARELHPRQILRYDIETGEIELEERDFFEIDEEEEKEIEEFAEEIKELFLEAVEKRVPDGELALLFSGGVDSTMVAAALQELGKDFTAYTSGIQHGNVNAPRDMGWAEKVAEQMGIELESHESSLEEVENELENTVDWISSTSVVKNGVALPFHLALNGDEKVVMSGLGSEQLYAGYHRQQGYLNRECLSGLRGIFEQDLYRDNVISFRNGYELRVPFLDHDLVEHALTIPAEYKQDEEFRKYVLRKAAEKLGVPEEVAWRRKTAAQYGSNFDKAIDRLSRNRGFGHKQEFLNSLRDTPNRRLVGLTSGGKDSNAAIYRMMRRNNSIDCLLTLESENSDSYMFDTRNSIVEEQAEKLGIPLIVQETEGEKEEELEDLKKGLERAREEYGIEGVVAGAIESTYQRDRVENVCENLGLKVFTPLWQENPANYMRWLVREGFGIRMSHTAARGLDEEWRGKILDDDSLEELLDLAEEYRFHPAGEGGEFETEIVEFPDLMV
jgi:asparagine synthase (glutamine-hydrolysing)